MQEFLDYLYSLLVVLMSLMSCQAPEATLVMACVAEGGLMAEEWQEHLVSPFCKF